MTPAAVAPLGRGIGDTGGMKRIPIVGGVIGARVAWHVAAPGVGDAWRGRDTHAAMLDSPRL